MSSRKLIKTLEHSRGRKAANVFVAFSPDGKTVAGASGHRIKLWDVRTGKLNRAFETSSATILSIAFAAAGKTLQGTTADASGFSDVSWNVHSGKLLTTQKRVEPVVFSRGGEMFVSANESGVRLYDAGSGQFQRAMAQVNYPVHWLAFSPDGKLLAGARADGVVLRDDHRGNAETMWLWDTQTGKLLQEFSKHTWGVNAIAFSPNGNWLVSASDDGTVKIWQVK